jgi:hypothetical protein
MNTVEHHLSGIIGRENYPDMQEVPMIGFFIENRIHWQFDVENKCIQNCCFRQYIYLRKDKILVHNSSYEFYN